MILTVLIFAGLFLLAILPGLVLCGGTQRTIGGFAAIATMSLVISMLATALLGVAINALMDVHLPSIALAPVSLMLLAGAVLRTRTLNIIWPAMEWEALGAAALFLGYGVIAHQLAFTHAMDGSLLVHAWYNADWFKHVAHVQAVAGWGLPARDIFGGAQPLHYYWLSYVLPGAASAIGGDAWEALYLANLTYAFLMMLNFYGLVRATGASARLSAILVLLATIVTGRIEIWRFFASPTGISRLLAGPDAPPEPALVSLALYIPQHALALALLLSWAVTTLTGQSVPARLRWLTLLALAAVMTISTLFGGMLLGIYGLVELMRRRLAALPELGMMALGSILLVLLLNVVKFSDPTSSVASRVNPPSGMTYPTLMVAGGQIVAAFAAALGVTLLAALYALFKVTPRSHVERNLRHFSAALIVVPFLALPLAAITLGPSLAHEVFLRALNPPAIAFGILGGWVFSRAYATGGYRRRLAVLTSAVLVVLGLPAAIVREMWHGWQGDRFTTTIPTDDLAVLAALNNRTPSDIIIWQYPEAAFLARPPGRDVWAPIFGGRAVLASDRATDQRAARADLDLTRRFFSGVDVPIPARVGGIYLSRVLHPASYELLLSRMRMRPEWSEESCRPSACLFRRRKTL